MISREVLYFMYGELQSVDVPDDAELPESARSILTITGIPVHCGVPVRFEPALAQCADFVTDDGEIVADLWCLGWLHYAGEAMLCVRSNDASIWSIAHPLSDQKHRSYVNRGLEEFLLCVHAWSIFALPPRDLEDTDVIRAQIDRFETEIARADSTALTEPLGLWKGLLDDYRASCFGYA